MSPKLYADGFKWRNSKFIFYEEFIQSYDEGSDNRYIFEVDIKYLKALLELICHSYLKE